MISQAGYHIDIVFQFAPDSDVDTREQRLDRLTDHLTSADGITNLTVGGRLRSGDVEVEFDVFADTPFNARVKARRAFEAAAEAAELTGIGDEVRELVTAQ